jgi:hypothetical protein
MRNLNGQPRDDAPGIGAWIPWHPDEVMRQLAGVPASWCVAGGWALDLWLGKQTRLHHDLEIAVLRPDFVTFRARLSRFGSFFVAADDRVFLLPSEASPAAQHHQVWLLEESAKIWRLGIFLEPGDNDTWVFRRDETVRCPRSQMIATTTNGVPYLRPEGVLLYKAKATRRKDEDDFKACAPLIGFAARTWLKNTLFRLYPSHRWLDELR